jgi:MFS family permease
MTLKFFSLFFLQACGMGPVAVSAVGAAAPLAVAAASLAAGRAASVVGRLPLALYTRALDVVLLVGMAFLPTAGPHARAALVGAHLVRMAAANSTRPLVRAILMEHVPKRHRAKVNALDSVRTFSWSGSAALGGLLIERYGFGDTFLITAAVKLAAMVPLLPLLTMVEDGGRAGGGGGRAGRDALPAGRPRSAARPGARGARAPLLPASDSATSSPLAARTGRPDSARRAAAAAGERSPAGSKRVHRNDSTWSLRL